MNHLPIGLFDSGVGGLTVMKQIAELLPHENMVYLGDTARLPYGNKSPDAIRRFSIENASFLLELKIKLLVISCHTADTHAFAQLQQTLPIPVVGVTQRSFEALLTTTKTKRVAILGTSSTIGSGAIQKALVAQCPEITLFPVPCPLFAPFVEEGLQQHEAAYSIARHYLSFLKYHEIDAALLACTHYPLLKDPIQAALGPHVKLVEPAYSCAEQTKELLQSLQLLNTSNKIPEYRFFASDDPVKFRHLAKIFFPNPIHTVGLKSSSC